MRKIPNLNLRLLILLVLPILLIDATRGWKELPKMTNILDRSVLGYLTESTCKWKEVCKDNSQRLFRCKCPEWFLCLGLGGSSNSSCSTTGGGYVWIQPGVRNGFRSRRTKH